MKKLILSMFALAATALLVHAQGLISLQTGKGTVITNGASFGLGTGNAYTGAGSYDYELLVMPVTSWSALTSAQQSQAYNLMVYGTAGLSLWTDSGVSGVNAGGLTTGGINGMGGAGGTTSANWAAPSGANYNTAGEDYYTVVGWSANEGNWSQVQSSLVTDNWAPVAIGWFGQTGPAYNYSGGGPDALPPVSVWAGPSVTGLSGSGMPSSAGALQLLPIVPEPTTLALAGLGGLSVLLLRRRKA